MTNTLETICAEKRREVAHRKERFPIRLLEESIFFETPVASLTQYLSRGDLVGVIAEIKRRSPSRGEFHKHLSVEQLSIGYMQAGASALSILTDERFFGGSDEDLKIARRFNWCPILRKDFILDEYQVYEARALGADVILLIAAALSPSEIASIATTARSLGFEVLLEVHSAAELERSPLEHVHLIGVNSRDLRDFSVDLSRAKEMTRVLPAELPWIAESGISSPAEAAELRRLGFSGFLIGEAFLRESRPDQACRNFISEFRGELQR